MRIRIHQFRNFIAIALLIIFVMSLYAWLGMTWISHDILEAKLPAGCSMLFFSEDVQVVFTVAVGCLGKDLVRVWPLPMQSHWFEDCWEPVDGEIRNQLEGI